MRLTAILPTLCLVIGLFFAQNACHGNKNTIGSCTITSFTDITDSLSTAPTTGECQDACSGVLNDAGDWIVKISGDSKQMIVGFACALSLSRGPGEPDNYSFSMHNQDIVDILDEVSLRFGHLHGGKVAATGTMVCEGHQVNWYVD